MSYNFLGSKTVGKIISLGYYKNNSDINLSKHKSEELPYFEQIYDGGTVCDVTDKSRLSRVWVRSSQYFLVVLMNHLTLFI